MTTLPFSRPEIRRHSTPGHRAAALLAVAVLLAPRARAQDSEPPSQECHAAQDQNKRYFLFGDANVAAGKSKSGASLLIVLPGGDGSAEFRPFVGNIFREALPEGFLLAQLVAVKWTPEQETVWPTERNFVDGQKFSTEQFIADVIADVSTLAKIDPQQIFTLSWSSGGPAAYAAALQPSSPIRGSFIAMSVFKPEILPPLENGKGRAFYIYHSPEDKSCPPRMAKQAFEQLRKAGALVRQVEYKGGHGWHGNVYEDMQAGIIWLQRTARSGKTAAAPRDKPAEPPAPTTAEAAPAARRNLAANGGFEEGLGTWMTINNSNNSAFELDTEQKKEGAQSLRLKRSGTGQFDVLRLNVPELGAPVSLAVSAWVRGEKVSNAYFKFYMYDAAGKSLIDDVDIRRMTGNSDWRQVRKTFGVPDGAVSAAVMFVMAGDGTLWVDDVRVEVVAEREKK
ncbi:MAG: hypothetical protein CHACPFDD_02696 [Phycisphaerae bacterium]|nr:hypothetical protein [Phycisphaerae bacterium]